MILFIVLIAVAFIVLSSTVFKIHPLAGLLIAALFVGISAGIPIGHLVDLIGKGFGDLMTKIGLMVILGCVIGAILDKSGAAIKVADLIIASFGKKHPTFAMSVIGALVGIPVFCDSGFIILSKLNRIVAQKSKIPLGTIAIGLSGGLFATHTLVPPTPGPLSVAGNFNISDSIGLVIIVGLVVSIPSLFLSTWFAGRFAKNLKLVPDYEAMPETQTENLPNAWLAFMPILLPIFLISLASFAKIFQFPEGLTVWLSFIGSPLVSFLLAIFLSYFLFPINPAEKLTECFKSGINHCGTTLVLVGAGGAFGAVLKETPLKQMMTDWLMNQHSSGLLLLLFAFAIAAFFKTAQGSTTSSMVLTSSLLAPILLSVGFEEPFELTLLLMAVGSGAMVVSHANDAWFWVVSQFTGISQKDAYRTHTLLTGLQGLVSIITVCLLYFLFN